MTGGTTKNGKKSNRKKVNGNSTTNNNIASNATTESNVITHAAATGSAAISQPITNGIESINNTLSTNVSSKPAKKVNKTSEMLQTISNTTVNKNLDEVLKTVRQLDNTCDFARCKTKTSLIYQDCKLCDQRFCMKHQLPEVHGCGGAIKKTERNEFLRPRTIPISAALRRNEQKDAHTRLEQKLKEMSLARQKAKK